MDFSQSLTINLVEIFDFFKSMFYGGNAGKIFLLGMLLAFAIRHNVRWLF